MSSLAPVETNKIVFINSWFFSVCKVEKKKKNISGEKTCSSCVKWKLWTWKLVKRFLISFQLYKLQRKKVVPLFIFQGNNIFVRKEGKVFEGESKVQAEIFFFVWNVRFFIFLTKKNSPDKSLFYSFTHEKNKFSWKFFLLFGFTDEGIKSEIVSLTVLVQFIYSCKNKHEDFVFPPKKHQDFFPPILMIAGEKTISLRLTLDQHKETVLDLSLRASVLKKHFSWLSVCLKSKHK